jgi:hypothetical protein
MSVNRRVALTAQLPDYKKWSNEAIAHTGWALVAINIVVAVRTEGFAGFLLRGIGCGSPVQGV